MLIKIAMLIEDMRLVHVRALPSLARRVAHLDPLVRGPLVRVHAVQGMLIYVSRVASDALTVHLLNR